MDDATQQAIQAQWERYMAAAHAVQTGVMYTLQFDPTSGTPKHLRVGIDTTKAEAGGLVRLLIEKGIFTELEYVTAMAEALEREVEAYQRRLTERFGGTTNITLG